jgi:hypothetical protein
MNTNFAIGIGIRLMINFNIFTFNRYKAQKWWQDERIPTNPPFVVHAAPTTQPKVTAR